MGSSGRFSILCSCAVIVFAQAFTADAEQIRVLKDSYIVEYAPQAAALGHARAGRSQEGFDSRPLGNIRGKAIGQIRRRNPSRMAAATLSEEQEFIPLDPEDRTCIELVKGGDALACSPDYEVHISRTSNDDIPWGVESIGSRSAWDRTTGSADVVVAVLDTGVDYSHSDLAANMWTNPFEIPGNGIDDDGNGFIDDVHGINTLNSSGDPMDDNGHGTHVAGTIGAVGNNGTGVAGVNWTTRIMALKFLGSSGSGSLSGAIRALQYIMELKAKGVNVRVVNNSWGGGGFSQALFDAFKAAGDGGVIMAVAAGNESNDNDSSPTYPAGFDLPNVVSVAAIDQNKNLASFSNFGASSVDIAAPGVSILSLAPGNRRATMSGTSMAAPHVAGALMLLFASDGNLNVESALSRLYESGTTLATLSGIVRTGRSVNVGRAVLGETSPIPVEPQPELCSYTAERNSVFDPDRSADSASVSLSGDELEFKSIPFDFLFFGRNAQRVVLSLNGVAYVDRTPQDMDYRNGSRAPAASIAALHTDLTAPQAPLGVRYRVSSDRSRLTASWRMRHYSSSEGEVRVWLEINRSGEIKSCTSMDEGLSSQVRASSTLGVSPASPANGVTYPSDSLESAMCVRYVPQCLGQTPPASGEDVQVARIKIAPGRTEKSLVPGHRLRVSASGTGSGSVSLSTALNGRTCPTTRSITMRNGKAAARGVVPRSLNYRRSTRITISAGEKRSSKYVYGRYAVRADRERRLSDSSFNRLCRSLVRSLH